MWGFVYVNALKHLRGEKSLQKSGAVYDESVLWILPFLSLSVINNTPKAVCCLECWAAFCWHMGFLGNVSQIQREDPTGSQLPVLSTAPVCLWEAKLQHAACTLLSKHNLQAFESRA